MNASFIVINIIFEYGNLSDLTRTLYLSYLSFHVTGLFLYLLIHIRICLKKGRY